MVSYVNMKNNKFWKPLLLDRDSKGIYFYQDEFNENQIDFSDYWKRGRSKRFWVSWLLEGRPKRFCGAFMLEGRSKQY